MVLKIFILFLYFFPSNIYSCLSTSSAASPVISDTTTTTTSTTATTTTTAAELACATCTGIDRLPATIGTDQTLTPVVTTGADGCVTIALTCSPDAGITQTLITFYQAGADVGTLQGADAVMATLACNDAGELTYTNEFGTGVVDQVECTGI